MVFAFVELSGRKFSLSVSAELSSQPEKTHVTTGEACQKSTSHDNGIEAEKREIFPMGMSPENSNLVR